MSGRTQAAVLVVLLATLAGCGGAKGSATTCEQFLDLTAKEQIDVVVAISKEHGTSRDRSEAAIEAGLLTAGCADAPPGRTLDAIEDDLTGQQTDSSEPTATPSSSSTAPASIDGATLGKAVNARLVATVKPVSSSTDCPDIRFERGASVTCAQTEVLDGGRQLEVPVTVTLTKADDSGAYAYDYEQADKPTRFGLTGTFIANDLKTQWNSQKGGDAAVSCPDYLDGVVGTSIDCTLTDAGTDHTIKVTVDKIDEATFDTNYTFAEE